MKDYGYRGARPRADVKAELIARNSWVPAPDFRHKKVARSQVLTPKSLLTAVCNEYLGEGFSVSAEKRPSQAAPKPACGRPAWGEVRSYNIRDVRP